MAISFHLPRGPRRGAQSGLLSLVLLMGVTCGPVASAQEDFQARADEVVQAFHDAGLFNGTLLVASGDEVIYERALGYADLSWRIPHTPDTRFRIASTTKQFTSALVHRLAEDGLVDLDAPLSTYLPDYPTPQADRITVRHLLNHTAGIPNYTSLPVWESIMRDRYTPEALLDVFAALPLQFEPGSGFRYSNSNYAVLGAVVERVTGDAYATALRERILEPLGLHDTGYDTGEVIERKASGYDRIGADLVPERYLDVSLPYAAGMLYSTVRDLHRWKRALHEGRLFQNAETLSEMLTPSRGEPYGYANGLAVNRRPYGTDTLLTVGHGGHIEGFNSDDRYLPEREWTVIVLDNTNGDVGRVGTALIHLLLGHDVETPRVPVSQVMESRIAADGIEAAVAHYRTLRRDHADQYDFAEEHLNALGYRVLRQGDAGTAIRLFRLNVEAYPDSWNVHDSLGEALAAAGRAAESIAAYERSLDLNPDNTNGREALDRLRHEPAD